MAAGNDELIGFWLSRHYSKLRRRRPAPNAPPPRPTMPKRQWRLLATACLLFGVALGVAISGAFGWRPVAGGVVGGLTSLVGGMWVIETIWERRQR